MKKFNNVAEWGQWFNEVYNLNREEHLNKFEYLREWVYLISGLAWAAKMFYPVTFDYEEREITSYMGAVYVMHGETYVKGEGSKQFKLSKILNLRDS